MRNQLASTTDILQVKLIMFKWHRNIKHVCLYYMRNQLASTTNILQVKYKNGQLLECFQSLDVNAINAESRA